MDKQEVFCKANVKGKITYVQIIKRGDQWEYNDFVLSLGINADVPVFDILHITDSFGVEIQEEYFIRIFFQNYTSSDFVLGLKIKEEDGNPFSEISSTCTPVQRQNCRIGHEIYLTTEELENYLLKSQHSYVLLKKFQPQTSELAALSDVERRAIIREGVNFLVAKYTHHPEHEHKLALAYAIIKLFPQLKSNDRNNEVDLLYNRIQNRGYIVNKLNNIRSKLYKLETVETRLPISKKRLNATDKNENKKRKSGETIQVTNSNAQEDLLILKNLNVHTQTNLIKEKLTSTLNYRKECFKNNSFKKISQEFPFFFICPDLISFDFELRYPDVSQNFTNNWPSVAEIIEKVWRGFKGAAAVPLPEIDIWVPSYQKIFYLLNLLPQTSIGKSSKNTKRLPFRDCINHIVCFKPLNLPNDEILKTAATTAPFIVAIGENTKAISSFNLCVEREFIPLPTNFTFLDALDVLFKVHYVLNQHFDESIKNFWLFISHFFFKIENELLPVKLKDVATKIEIELSKDN